MIFQRNAALPNMIITGTGPFAFAGVTSVISMSTLIDGHAELSACPTSCFSTTGKTPAFESLVLFTAQVTLGTLGGTRPSTSRSKSSTISGRRCCHHCSADVTFLPVFQRERVGQIPERIGLRLIVVGVIGSFLISARPWTKRLDAQLIHHVLMVLFRRPILRRRLLCHDNRTHQNGETRRMRQPTKVPASSAWARIMFDSLTCPSNSRYRE